MELVQSANLEGKSPGRVEQVDILRGFALLGIGLENLFAMHTTNDFFADYSAQYGGGVNHWLLLGLMILVRGKFYPIFSFVFGMSAALGLPTQGSRYFLRRLVGLFLLGALQILFIWEGDVLMQYVLMGVLLLLLRNQSGKFLTGLGACLLLFSFLGKSWGISDLPEVRQDLAVYQSGSFTEMMVFRVQEYLQGVFTWRALFFYSRIFAFMLLGYAFVKSRSINVLMSFSRLRKVFLVHVGLAVGIALAIQLASWRGENGDGWLKDSSLAIYFYAAVMSLAFLPVLLWRVPKASYLLTRLQWLGRLTLTHYLVQNLLFSLLFYKYGLGLFLRLEPWQCVLLYVVVILIQLCLSIWLLRHFRLGPVEFFLRRIAGEKQKGVS
ncbi:DUF418 domain-containing protein [Rufibacter sediminis]|uniref:DUF418 domain-containing protein n=1 Tax=Rufibacter sediminis TaxID=2762756 RepID=A0ABR6VT94_9BACT|nr:DUF418 domain-containing protein [Rufibacter sediminis]MBC3540394.1 DUF418 domain-containing protein [Rufibacter sediminis]